MQKGDKVKFIQHDADYNEIILSGEIIDTWYEPGDPIMGVTVLADNGQTYGSLDSQDVWPNSKGDILL